MEVRLQASKTMELHGEVMHDFEIIISVHKLLHFEFTLVHVLSLKL